MATAAKFVQPIQIFLAYLVPLPVDVVPIKFHQFLFSEYPAMPKQRLETYCFCSVSSYYYYYYVAPNAVG
jgi:hypothetical protein